MRHLILSLLGGNMVLAQNLVIEKQGHFSVSGSVIQHKGAYDNSKFVGWATQVETGQSSRVNHAFVDYQIPANAHQTPLVYVHGYGGSGGVLGDDTRWQGWFLDLDASPWLEQLCNGLARSWQGWPYFGNYGSEAIGRRDVLVRHLAYGHLS